MNTEERIIRCISQYSGLPPQEIDKSMSMEDPGMDSLDAVEVVMEIEDECAMEIPDEQIEKFSSIGGIISYVDEKKRR